jgi:hypothetical protein
VAPELLAGDPDIRTVEILTVAVEWADGGHTRELTVAVTTSR